MKCIRNYLFIQVAILLTVILSSSPSFAQNCSYPNDKRLETAQSTCSSSSARSWSCELNRCVNSSSAQDLREKFKACAEIENESKRKACHDKLAKNESATKNNKDGPNTALATSSAAIGAANALMIYFSNMGARPKGQCLSRKIYMAGAVVSVLAELYLRSMAEGELDKLQKKYAGEKLSEEAHAAQLRALEYLKKEQELIANLAGTRKNAYTVQLAFYGASLAVSLTEIATGTQVPTPCISKEAEASEEAPVEGLTATLAGYGDILGTSVGISIASGISTTLAYLLRKAAADQEAEASSNVKKVQTLINKFKDVTAGSSYCSPAQRKQLSNPKCYCYQADGSQNPSREKSVTCQNLFKKDGENYNVAANSYSFAKKNKSKVCMLINGQIDRDCKCRQLLNKTTGENACLKVPIRRNSIGILGATLGIAKLTSGVNNLANGNTSLGNLKVSGFEKQIARNNQLAAKALGDFNANRAEAGLPPIKPFDSRHKKKFFKLIGKKATTSSSIGNLAISSRPTSGELADAIRAAESKSGLTKKSYYKGGLKGLRANRESKADDYAYLSPGGRGGGGKIKSYMAKKYDYKSNDIVENKSVSIWKVISSRYLKSGVRRLFEEAEDN